MKTLDPTCAIAYSTKLLGDKWYLLILRDIILHKKTRFKEFRSSKENIATNILSNRLKSMKSYGFIELLDPEGTKKSRQYIATNKGLSVLPIIIEFYLLSIHSIDESLLNKSQMMTKNEILQNRNHFEKKKKESYLNFVNEQKIMKSVA